MNKVSILSFILTVILSACAGNGTNTGQLEPTQGNNLQLTEEPTMTLVPSKTSTSTTANSTEAVKDECIQLKLTSAECANLGTHEYSSVLTAVGNCGWKNLKLTVKETNDFSESSVFINSYEMKKTDANTYSYNLVNSAGTLESGTVIFSVTGFIYDQRIESKSGTCTIHGEYTLMDLGG